MAHRWKEHLRDFRKEKNKKRPLYEAMTKYGPENFVISELEYCENCEYEIEESEETDDD